MSDTADTKQRAPPQDANPNDEESKSTNNSNTNDTSEDDEVLAKFPLCMCPGCDKVLGNMKSLFGHFGRAHRTAINHDAIKYLCPFCDDGPDDEIFNSKTELESHVGKSHPGCKLMEYFTSTTPRSGYGKKKKKKPSSSSAPQGEALAPRRSSRQKEEICVLASSSKSNANESSSSVKQRYLHPRCKCPSCDKILQPQGLFGHFGRVHSGQLGHVAKFEWKNVSFACPFCSEEGEGEGEQPQIFRTFELVEGHVASHHPNCHLTRPNAVSSTTPKKVSSSAKPDFASTLSSSQRKSQRSSRRSSINDDMDVDDDDEDDVAPRKSQRKRRSPPSAKPSNDSIKRAAAVVNDYEEDKPLYSCPDCDKTNLTKHGLHAHYGMKHGGSVNMDRVKMVRQPKKKKPANTSNTGPWTDEEHEAFLAGHSAYGNSWKRISTEFVPTRDAKQIGSHALNYFTTRGKWRDTLGSRTEGPRGMQSGYVDEEEGNRRPKRDSSGKSRFTIDMDNDIYDDEEYSVDAEEKDESVSEGDDGNSSHCIVCFGGGTIVCCSKCPRAYHPKCLAKDGHGGINVDMLPNDWQCNRCKKDHQILPGDEIPQYAFGNKKIRAAFSEFKDCSDFSDCCALLSNILDMLAKLKSHDYGFVFSEPVHLEVVPDYVDVVKTPMDYGTVIERLGSGNYVDLIASDDLSRHDENSTMEEILLHVLCDVERVHHNCHLYNKKGSSIYRIGEVHANKWDAYFTYYILDRLPENVQRDLALFRHRCKLEQLEYHESCSKKVNEAAKSSRITLTTNQKKKKRKTSEPAEEEHGGIMAEDTDGEEEEQELQRKANRTTQEESTGHSRALLFTEEQVRSLEHVFFSSPSKLRDELDDLDVCSTLTSPQASSPNANDDVKIEDNPSDTPAAASTAPAGVESEPLASAKSEEGLDEEKPGEQVPDVATTYEEKPGEQVPDVATTPPTMQNNPDPPVPQEELNEKEPALHKSSSCSSLPRIIGTVDVDNIASVVKSPSGGTPMSLDKCGSTIFQRQWYDRLNELKRFKVTHGTAVVSATKNDKLYHWRLRQRKRYHLTLFRMPHLKKDSHSWDDGGHSKDKEWLLVLPEMKGVFALSSDQVEADDIAPTPFALSEKDIESDEKVAESICMKHREQLYCPAEQYCPSLPVEVLLSRHSSRFKNSLFWDECLEELRFFQGEHQHTIVPRDFPYNNLLPIWVEIQRAKYLLQNMGLFTGLTGSQMFALDELNFCDLSPVSTLDSILASPNSASRSYHKKKKFMGNFNAEERKSWTSQVSAFKEWFETLPPEDKPRASDLLPRANWQLYSWCWRQCNGSAAVLCGTPNISGITISVKKMNNLASAKFYHAFPYNDRGGLVREDDYEGCDAFESTFQVLEDFSIKYGSTLIPDWYECDGAFRMWVGALENGLMEFVQGEPCVLSASQIEQLILIGFCNDRDGLPNLTKSDVVWLKMFMEIKRHRELFGVCSVSSNFPRLCNWVAEQKELFRLSRMGRKDMMSSSRLKMLMEVGVDFFTGECLPGESDLILKDFKDFEQLTSSPIEDFPVNSSAVNAQSTLGWNFQYDNFWNSHDCRTKFEQFKAQHGHSLVLVTDDEDVYWWFVEKRGKALLTEISSAEPSQAVERNEFHSHSMLRYIITQRNEEDDTESAGDNEAKVDHSIFTWVHYCERLLMFKARVGHCKIPQDYPDGHLRRWLVQQQDLIHCYSTGQTTDLLPAQLKMLQAIGVHGCKRLIDTTPKPSSRTLKRKFPSKRDKKRGGDSDKLKSSSPRKNANMNQ